MSAFSYCTKGIRGFRCIISAPLHSYRIALRRSLFGAASTCNADTIEECASTNIASKQMWLFGVAALLIGFSTASVHKSKTSLQISLISASTISTTRCDGEPKGIDSTDDPDSNGPHNDFGAKPVENDPYANLPEVDEETSCDICNTFRKGPCRKYWRKTERCWKEGDADKCLPYSTPFINCSMYYRNLYLLVMLDNFQEYVTAMEDDAKSVAVREFSDEPTDYNAAPFLMIDWNPWNEFNKDFGPAFSQTIPLPQSDAQPNIKLPLWKRLPADTEPILVPCNIKIPIQFTSSRDDNKLMQLNVAYVADQDGFVIGKYFKPSNSSLDDDSVNHDKNVSSISSEPSTETASDGDTTPSSKTDDSRGNDGLDDEDVHADISCIFLPGETKSIVVTAYYADESRSDFNEESEEEATVYKKEYDLYRMLSQCK